MLLPTTNALPVAIPGASIVCLFTLSYCGSLIDLAIQKTKSKSLVVEAAIASLLTPDDSDRREAALARRLDWLTRQVERLQRHLTISVEVLALFVHY